MRKSLEWILTGALIAGLTAAAIASETVSFAYDARGRLIRVEHGGTVNNGVVTNYTHDKADNRISKATTL
jgi:YD repeat-containing protein